MKTSNIEKEEEILDSADPCFYHACPSYDVGEISFPQDRIVNRLGLWGDQAENLRDYKTSVWGQISGFYLGCSRFDAEISLKSASNMY